MLDVILSKVLRLFVCKELCFSKVNSYMLWQSQCKHNYKRGNTTQTQLQQWRTHLVQFLHHLTQFLSYNISKTGDLLNYRLTFVVTLAQAPHYNISIRFGEQLSSLSLSVSNWHFLISCALAKPQLKL